MKIPSVKKRQGGKYGREASEYHANIKAGRVIGTTKRDGENWEPPEGQTHRAKAPIGKHVAAQEQAQRLQSNRPKTTELQGPRQVVVVAIHSNRDSLQLTDALVGWRRTPIQTRNAPTTNPNQEHQCCAAYSRKSTIRFDQVSVKYLCQK